MKLFGAFISTFVALGVLFFAWTWTAEAFTASDDLGVVVAFAVVALAIAAGVAIGRWEVHRAVSRVDGPNARDDGPGLAGDSITPLRAQGCSRPTDETGRSKRLTAPAFGMVLGDEETSVGRVF